MLLKVVLLMLVSFVNADISTLDYDEPILGPRTDPKVYRLPEDFDPIHYDLEITPYFTSTLDREAFTFEGTVTLTVKALKDGITAIVIHENVREILAVTLTNETGALINLDPLKPVERIPHHFLRINLADEVSLVNGNLYKLTLLYIGNMNETPLTRGMFRGNYRDAKFKLRWYAATHLQPTNSRQLFPSFDEPGFKSTFNITVNRPAHFTETYSNMHILRTIPMDDRVKEIFHRTPKMSAYLVTLHISQDFKVIADNNDTVRPYRILARSNAQGQGDYALEVGPPITRWLGDYLGIDYYSMGLVMKNDQIASPHWASGATENWGLVTYRELRLLYQEGETNALDKLFIGTITAHELAHKWFGNLITCRWWDNVWINEGFASYFEYFAMDAVDHSLELEDQFNLMYLQSALSADSSASTRALQHTVNSPAEVTGHFSGITYSKGASLLLMLKHFVTERTFRKALFYFLVDRAFTYALPSDLYQAFQRAVFEDESPSIAFDITSFIKYWVEEPGYPVLNVNVSMDTGLITLSQERFFITPSENETDQVWPLPLTYTTGNDINFYNLIPSKVMTTRTDTIQKTPGNEWVVFNLQQKGIYRVNYDTNNWEMLGIALKNNYAYIHHLNRAQIVDDVFALMRSERMTYELGFRVLEFLKKDTSYYVWYPAISGINWLRNRFLHLPEELAEFDKMVLELMDTVIGDLTYDVTDGEPLTRTLNRFYVLSLACEIGHEGCVNDALQKFNAMKNNNVSVNPNLRRHVFCVGLQKGGYLEWRWLYDRQFFTNNQADDLVMLRALGCTSNGVARYEYIDMIMNYRVKEQDRLNAFTFFYMGHRENARFALQFVKYKVNDIRQAVVLQSTFENLLINLAAYLDNEGLQDMEQWLNANQNSLPEYTIAMNAVRSARANMEWGTANAHVILRAARGSAAAVLPLTLMLVPTMIAMIL